jgi:translation initiation factor IF-2
LHIPLIIAVNKIDRPEADVQSTMLDLASHNLVPEEMGGNQIVVPISAKERINLDKLKQKITSVAKERVNLLEDFSVNAQCIVIESDVNEKSG